MLSWVVGGWVWDFEVAGRYRGVLIEERRGLEGFM
jgi:hypothetical protein